MRSALPHAHGEGRPDRSGTEAASSRRISPCPSCAPDGPARPAVTRLPQHRRCPLRRPAPSSRHRRDRGGTGRERDGVLHPAARSRPAGAGTVQHDQAGVKSPGTPWRCPAAPDQMGRPAGTAAADCTTPWPCPGSAQHGLRTSPEPWGAPGRSGSLRRSAPRSTGMRPAKLRSQRSTCVIAPRMIPVRRRCCVGGR